MTESPIGGISCISSLLCVILEFGLVIIWFSFGLVLIVSLALVIKYSDVITPGHLIL